MKKLLCTLLILGIVSLLGINTAQAATTDTFQITITCNFISINLRNTGDTADYTTWAVGQKAENTATTMIQADGIKVVNTANAATDLSAWVSTQAANWTNQSAAGTDQYKLEMKCFDATQATPDLSTGTATITSTSTPGEDIKAGLAATTNQWAYVKFTTPTSTTSGSQQTITVTILAATAS
jgi:hypothetical protein